LPVIKTHGFAMTSWKLMCRWPWWSVDSATWIKLASYGWILVPRWDKRTGFRYDVPPMQVNVSRKVTKRMNRFAWTTKGRHPRQCKDKHYDNAKLSIKEDTDRWLGHLGVELNSTEEEPYGVSTNFRARSLVNLHYLKDLEESRPKWPWPLAIRDGVGDAQRTWIRKSFEIL